MVEAKSLEDLRRIEPEALEVYWRYLDELDDADVQGAGHSQKSKQAEPFTQVSGGLGCPQRFNG
ncbi:MAG: hypothetical protein ABR985_19965 [Methanotrichaceae archaeon]